MKTKLDLVKELNQGLNAWKYGILINGKVITDEKLIDWSNYKTIPIKDIERYHVGICWDFVNYQHHKFKRMDVRDDSYLFVMNRSDDPSDIVTHTFSIITIGNDKYWFESSWFKHQGLHKISSYKDVINKLLQSYGKKPYDVYKYNPDGLDRSLSNGDFFKKATTNLVRSTV